MKKKDFPPPNKTKMSFLLFIYFVGARMTWRKRIGQEHFRGSLTRDMMCRPMIEQIISRASLTMMRRVRP